MTIKEKENSIQIEIDKTLKELKSFKELKQLTRRNKNKGTGLGNSFRRELKIKYKNG